MNPVELYCKPGREVQQFRDVQMTKEFQEWIDKVQPTLQMHNIQPSEPIQIDLPAFAFKSESSLATRMNRLNIQSTSELNVKSLKISETEAEEHFATPTHVDIVTEHATIAKTEHAAIVEDVYNTHETPEINFQRWAQHKHPNTSLMSFIPIELNTEGKSMSQIFDANTAHVDDLGALRDYFIVATTNTADLSQTMTFIDGTNKHIDNEMLFSDDMAVERTLNTLMSSEKPLYFIEYLN